MYEIDLELVITEEEPIGFEEFIKLLENSYPETETIEGDVIELS